MSWRGPNVFVGYWNDATATRNALTADGWLRTGDVAVGNRKIADIGDVLSGRRRPGDRVVAIDQHAARLADRRRPEAGAGPVRGPEIEGDPGDANRRRGIIALDPEKARPHGKSRGCCHAFHIGIAA